MCCNCLAQEIMKTLTSYISISSLDGVFVILFIYFFFFFMFPVYFFSVQLNSWKKRVANLTRELEDVKTDLSMNK